MITRGWTVYGLWAVYSGCAGARLCLEVHIHDTNIADQVDHEVDHTFVYKIRGFDCVIHLIHLRI